MNHASAVGVLPGSTQMDEIHSPSCRLLTKAPPESAVQRSRVNPSNGQIPSREFDKLLGRIGWVIPLIRQKVSWSPRVIACEFWRLLTNISTQREILSLLSLTPFDEIARKTPALAFKYVVPDYLARGFTVKERASCFLHHYKRMHAVLSENALRQILQGNVSLHEISNGVNDFTLTMGLSEPVGRLEGELSVDLRVDGKRIFNLSFTIVPGWVVKSEAEEILLITRLQGTLGCHSQIRLARKAFHEFSPKKLLLAVLQGIAEVFGIRELVAVCGTNQRGYEKEYAATLKRSYDDFFAHLGMVKTASGFYSSRIPIEGKPLASIKGRNRSRARKSRAMRRQIHLACTAFLLGTADRTASTSSGAMNQTSIQADVESRASLRLPEPDYN
jgi:uncharacterized protein VirK/YbjX